MKLSRKHVRNYLQIINITFFSAKKEGKRYRTSTPLVEKSLSALNVSNSTIHENNSAENSKEMVVINKSLVLRL